MPLKWINQSFKTKRWIALINLVGRKTPPRKKQKQKENKTQEKNKCREYTFTHHFITSSMWHKVSFLEECNWFEFIGLLLLPCYLLISVYICLYICLVRAEMDSCLSQTYRHEVKRKQPRQGFELWSLIAFSTMIIVTLSAPPKPLPFTMSRMWHKVNF